MWKVILDPFFLYNYLEGWSKLGMIYNYLHLTIQLQKMFLLVVHFSFNPKRVNPLSRLDVMLCTMCKFALYFCIPFRRIFLLLMYFVLSWASVCDTEYCMFLKDSLYLWFIPGLVFLRNSMTVVFSGHQRLWNMWIK
mgnify:CR=1 FL=1